MRQQLLHVGFSAAHGAAFGVSPSLIRMRCFPSSKCVRGFGGRGSSRTPKALRGDIPMHRVVQTVGRQLWPPGHPKLKLLVVCSVTCMVIAKATRVAVPFWFKTIVDTLAPSSAAAAGAVVGAVPLGVFGLVAAYGITRLTTSLTDELKGAVFAPVGAHAATQVLMGLFEKIHGLDLQFHLSRQTGVMAKDIDRGSRAFWSLTYVLLFMAIPTAFEITLVCGILSAQAGTKFVAVAATAVVAYVGWTHWVTTWRVKIRHSYNAADSALGGLLVDSLLNFETIKYFGREAYELERVGCKAREMNYLTARLDQSLALLNFGQQTIFTVAATVSLYFATCGVLAGAMTVGDLVLIDALLLQLYQPLSWLGMLYREIQSSTQNMQA
eukprot:RCo015186